MKLNREIIGTILVFLILATIACGGDDRVSESGNQGDLRETSAESAEDETPTGDFWDGGDFAGKPIYSLTLGVSQAAHDAFSNCGLRDNAIEQAVEDYLQQNTERQMIIAQDSQQETLWSVAMTVTPLTADVFELSCSIVE